MYDLQLSVPAIQGIRKLIHRQAEQEQPRQVGICEMKGQVVGNAPMDLVELTPLPEVHCHQHRGRQRHDPADPAAGIRIYAQLVRRRKHQQSESENNVLFEILKRQACIRSDGIDKHVDQRQRDCRQYQRIQQRHLPERRRQPQRQHHHQRGIKKQPDHCIPIQHLKHHNQCCHGIQQPDQKCVQSR